MAGLVVENLYQLQANFIIVLVWGASILFATLPLMGWNRFVSEVGLKAILFWICQQLQ